MLLLVWPCNIFANIANDSWQYQRQIIRAGWTHFGTDAYVSVTAAQLHQESLFRPLVTSWAGAMGLAQFMPATAKGESARCGLGVASPYDPTWSIYANACYMAYLLRRNWEFKPGCEQMAATASAYNGGQGNVNKQRRLWAELEGQSADHDVPWYGGVAEVCIRGPAAHKENTEYAERILLKLTTEYVKAGYGGIDVCKDL